MLADNGIIAAIDVGTTKVCTVLGRRAKTGGMQITGHGVAPCTGLRKGNVADVSVTTEAIHQSLSEVERQTGHKVQSAFVGVTGSHVSFENRRDELPGAGRQGVITAEDLRQDPDSARDAPEGSDRELIHAIRMSYSIDGEAGIRNPLGMHSSQVEVETHLVTGGSRLIKRLVQAVEGVGITVDDLVLEPLASGLAVLTPEEKENGVVLVDIGGGTTDVVGFFRGRICYSGVIPVGGYQFTNDIALTYNTPYPAAEDAKLRYASTELHASVVGRDEIPLPVQGSDMELKVPVVELCQLIRERANELSRLIKLKLDEAEGREPWAHRIVLTGGASALPGLDALIQRNLAIPVRQGIPTLNGSVPDELNAPAFATSLGILMWAADAVPPAGEPDSSASNGNGKGRLLAGLFKHVTRLLPTGISLKRKGRN